jgi:putative membrane protein
MNKKGLSASLAALLGLLALPVVAQDAGTTGSHGASSPDQTFVNQAVHANDQEIDQAQAELRVTHDAGVVLFANTMIKDHTAANSQLGAVAKGLNLDVPASHIAQNDAGDNPTPPPAAYRSGAAPVPARTYMTNEVNDHQQAIALYEGEANNGASEQLRTYAAQTLPTLKAHLAMAQQYVATGHVSPEVTPTPAGPGGP